MVKEILMALFHGARPANLGLFPISNQAGKSIKSSFVLAMRHLFPFLFEKKTQKHPANNRFKADKNNIEITEEEMSKKHTHTHTKRRCKICSAHHFKKPTQFWEPTPQKLGCDLGSQRCSAKTNKAPMDGANSHMRPVWFTSLVGGFFPPHLKNMIVKLDHHPRDRGINKTCFKPPPSSVLHFEDKNEARWCQDVTFSPNLLSQKSSSNYVQNLEQMEVAVPLASVSEKGHPNTNSKLNKLQHTPQEFVQESGRLWENPCQCQLFHHSPDLNI